MAPRPLRPNDQVLLTHANSIIVRNALSIFAGGAQTTWLSSGHPHPDGCPPKQKALFQLISQLHLIELVAVRCPLHCADGWGYLARSISALLAGDTHAARHLSYYAELRAGLSILASDGIGIFNGQNIIIDRSGRHHELEGRPTHDMAWATLQHWATFPRSADRMLSSIELNGASLLDAVTGIFPAPGWASIGSQIIAEWGVDLSRSADDQHERNFSSYNPNDLTPLGQNFPSEVEFVVNLWRCFEPGNWTLERHLLRKVLEHATPPGGQLTDRANEYERLDPRLLSFVSMDFLTRRTEPDDHPVLIAARETSTPASATAMMARAALLLRIATSMAQATLRAATVNAFEDLEPWWGDFGSQRGFWSATSPPDPMDDLWQEISEAITAAASAAPRNRFEWTSNLKPATARLSEAERIVLWNFCR